MAATTQDDNPLLKDFELPPFDAVEAKHVRSEIRTLLTKLEADLDELECTVEPSWPKLVEPFGLSLGLGLFALALLGFAAKTLVE